MKADSEKGLFSIVIESISDCINITNQESEIDKIAKGLCKNPKEELVEKRKLVYDFFRTEIPKIRNKFVFFKANKPSQTVYYIDCEGKRKSFWIGIDCVGFHTISIDCGYIDIGGAFYTICEEETGICENFKGVLSEYIYLLAFDKFVNSRTEDFAFTNMFGQKVEEIARKYNLSDWRARRDASSDIEEDAGRELNKVLRRNYLYWKTKSSFQRAQKECEKVCLS